MQQSSDEEPPPVQAALRPAVVDAALIAHHQAFLSLLTQHLGQEAAPDVLQQFYLRALRKAGTLRKQESVVAWLYRLLHATLVDHLRRQTRRQRQEAIFTRHQATTVTDVDLEDSLCTCLYTLLPTLQPEYADILRRVDLCGEPRQKVAQELGLSVNNVTVRLHRARQALRKVLLLSCQICPQHGFLRCACDLSQRSDAAHRQT